MRRGYCIRKRSSITHHDQFEKRVLITSILLFMIGLVGIISSQLSIRFAVKTIINGVDCSFLTAEGANEKLNMELENGSIHIKVLTKKDSGEYIDKIYTINCNKLETKLDIDIDELLKLQKETGEKIFYEPYLVNEEKLMSYFFTISELQEENMIEPQDAYLQLGNDDEVEIISEVYGLKVDSKKAYEMIISELKAGKLEIDLTQIFEIQPKILSTDEKLVENKKEINKILKTIITFVFSDGTVKILDSSTIRNWIKSSDGLLYLDEENIVSYVEELAEISDEKNSTLQFEATGIEKVTFFVGSALRPNLNKDIEVSIIKNALEKGGNCNLGLVYDNEMPNNSESYVELDITRQKVWLYVDRECILETDCVTGNVSGGYSTPTGIYYLTYKTRGATLRGEGYASYVEYWMPFNGNIGFHDASWRSKFGGNIYLKSGSHGCVNMPTDAAKLLYENIDESMPIFVYAS